MKVKELIERLELMPSTAHVVVQVRPKALSSILDLELSEEEVLYGEEDFVPTDFVHLMLCTKPKTNQQKQWQTFSAEVDEHIEKYVIPQWGDMPDDQVSSYDAATMKANLMRYVGRIGQGQRGIEEAIRDCHKIAHYACRLRNILEESKND